MLNEKLINELYNTYTSLCESRQQDVEENIKEYAEDFIYSFVCYDC